MVYAPFIFNTDASSQGHGAILLQMHECQEPVIAYVNNALGKLQR